MSQPPVSAQGALGDTSADPDVDAASAPTPNQELTVNERVALYVDLWKKAVDVHQHFNDIEWRIRGLALTVATFALGAAGVAAKDGTQIGVVSLGSTVIFLGLVLWYAFYFVDRVWYHPLLNAAVDQATAWEREFQQYLPIAGETGRPGMTGAISAGSASADLGWLTRTLTRKQSMRSTEKLAWFYGVGATALLLAAVAFQLGASLDSGPPTPEPVIVRLENGQQHGAQTPPPRH